MEKLLTKLGMFHLPFFGLKGQGFWCVCCLICFCNLCFAQEIYEGDYEISDFSGTATYTYTLKKGDTLKTGPFLFQHTSQDNIDPIEIKGSFEKDIPVGLWEYSSGNYVPQKEKEFVDFSYVTKLDGLKKAISGNYLEGKPDSTWTIQLDSIRNSKLSSNQFKSEITYKEGIPQLSFTIETTENLLAGRLLRNGYAHDTWTLFTKDGINELENWVFDNGVLKEVHIRINDSLEKTISFNLDGIEDVEVIDLDENYLTIMEFGLQNRDTTHVFDHGLSSLLKENAAYQHQVEYMMSDLGASVKLAGMKVEVPKYELSREEERNLDAIADHYQKSQSIANTVLTDTRLVLKKLTDQKVALFYNSAEDIQVRYLEKLGKLLEYRKDQVISFIKRDDLIKGLWPSGLPPRVVMSQDTSGREITYPIQTDLTYKTITDNLQDVEDMAHFTEALLTEIQDDLGLSSNDLTPQKNADTKEDELVKQATQLKTYIDSIAKPQRDDIKKTVLALKENTDKQLQQYAVIAQDSVETKNRTAQELNVCFAEKRELVDLLIQIPEDQQRLKEAYTEEVYVIFTATTMEEQVKKHIINSYDEQILPELLKQLREGLPCTGIQAWMTTYRNIQDRLFKLRNEDTGRLERKLKREDNPQEVLRLLGVTQ
ncbi:hypothetical protein [Leeuwenhoekiella parthenopeia]|uniref:Uncharacterized protein n=1 Tax=Leeuwenhoekiella parthenopeia TaxID=2890320 RepID=A0ABS8GPY0_9FLAO|nr:hypothetical protein [Leeuwenhoekiella parthenopeia]MCC4212044.1 hypothetical protein [Leeuwenhoekiella parthenopeia]